MAITAGVGKGVEPYADVLFSRIASIGSSGVSMTMKPCVYHPTLGSALYDTRLRAVTPNAGMRPVEHQPQTPVDGTFDPFEPDDLRLYMPGGRLLLFQMSRAIRQVSPAFRW